MKTRNCTPKPGSAYPTVAPKFSRITLISIISFSTILLILFGSSFSIFGEKERFEEDEEGIPHALKSFDLWGDMRTYPGTEMKAAAFAKSFDKSLQMTFDKQQTEARSLRTNTPPWTALGPWNFGGRLLSIGFHPTDPNIMWVGSASGGLYKTTTGGSGGPGGVSWTFVPTGFPVLGISSIVVNPSNADELYIGTGEVYNPGALAGGSTGAGHVRLFRGSYGIGILKTTDGGTTWTKTLDFTNSNIKGVMDMLIHPTTPSTVFAATTDGVYRTTNSGASWELIHNVPMAMDMVFKPGNPDVIYVGCGNFQSAGTGIYKTTNANAVTPTFSQLTSAALPSPISGKIMLAISANNPNRVYASIGRNPDIPAHTQGLYVSTNEGSTWAAAGAPSILGSQGWYGHDVAVSPTNASRVLWGELDTYLSTNGGTSFTQRGFWNQWDVNNQTVGDLTEGLSNTTTYVHADVHRIIASPHDATGNTFFLCTDGGLFRTTNGGTAFNTLNGGLNNLQIYAEMSIHPTNPDYILLGLQDNEAAIYQGTPGSRRIGNLGDGFHTTMNSTGAIQIVESYYFNRRRSTNSGGTFGAGSGAVPEVACFNVPMVYSDAPASSYVYAGTVNFKRSADNGATWTNLNGGAPIAGANNPAIAMAAPTNDIVYFSTGPGSGVRSKLWKTTNATAGSPSFSEIHGSLPDRYYSDIDADPIDPNRLIVTLSGFGSSHVYMSLDGGSNWTDIGAGLPDVPANTVKINPANRQQVYIGNDLGVFYTRVPTSGSLGASYPAVWTAYNEGITDAIMTSDIQFTNTGELRLATYGRGLWAREAAPHSMLPVLFVDFTVRVTEDGNLCRWTVTDQVNVAKYEVEYSRDGTNFKKIATVNAVPGTGDIKYENLHRIYNDVDGYYRVKSIDHDGMYEYTPVRVVKAQNRVSTITAYPNPTEGAFQVRIPLNRAGSVQVQLFAADGKLVQNSRHNLQEGTNIVPMNISGFARGTYRLVCISNEMTWRMNILKK
jgi:hypothetical protein